MGWTIRRHGVDYDVVAADERRESVLLADGVEVDREVADYWESSTLTGEAITIEVRWGPRNTIVSVVLTEPDGDADQLPLVPPPGSAAARREAFAREHPVLFVVRRVGVAGLEILIGVLGVGALVTAVVGQLLPRIDLSWVPRPDLPDIRPPGWLRHLDPFSWIGRLGLSWPDVTTPAWIDAVLEHSKYWIPLVVAIVIALGELDRRRKRDAQRDDDCS